MNERPRPLFFDIEAGGLSGRRSSIYSISYSQGDQNKSWYARPVPGTQISRWSKENVWEPIKKLGQPIGSEKRALTGFLKTLEANKGGTIAGWNIGYMPSVQAQEYGVGATGFDIPMIMTRAGKYPGMRERYQKAFQNVQIRDVGMEYSVRLAQGLQKYPHLLDKDLYEQIVGYNKQIAAFQASKPNASIPEIARHMGQSGYRLSGWKQELVYGLAFPGKTYAAHQSEADIGAVRELAKHAKNLNITPEFASQWNREALSNTLTNQLIKGNKTPQAYQDALSRASKFGITSQFETSLAERVRSLGGDLNKVKAGLGAPDQWSNVRGSKIASAVEGLKTAISRIGGGNFAGAPGGAWGVGGKIDDIADFAKGHKGKLIAGGLLLGLYATKPGSLFNARGRDYNTIKAGSTEPETPHERQVRQRFDLITKNLDKYGTRAGTGHKRLLIGKDKLGSEEDIEKVLGFVPVSIAIPEAGQDTLTSWRHPTMNYHIHSHDKEWTIHEDEHAALTMQWANKNDKSSSIAKFIGGVSHIFAEGVPGAYYYAKGQLSGAADMSDRLHDEMTPEYKKFTSRLSKIKPERIITRIRRYFSGHDDDYNAIEGLRHGGEAEQKRHKMTDFGSGWIRKALSKGIDPVRIASAASKLGTGTFEGSRVQFASKVLKGLRGGDVTEAVKFVRGSQGVTIGGERFVLGKSPFASGGFGKVFKAWGVRTNRVGAYKVLKKTPEALGPGEVMTGPAFGAAASPFMEKARRSSTPRNLMDVMRDTPEGRELAGYVQEYGAQMTETGAKYGLMPGSLQYEAKMQELAREQMGNIVPEVYGVTDKGLMTEFAGSAITGGKYKVNAIDWIEQRWGNDLTSGGMKLRHFDPQVKNIVRRGGKYRIIDFGVAAEGPSLSMEAKRGAETSLSAYREEVSTPIREAMASKAARRTRFIQGHQEGVKLAAQNTLRPGQRHTQQAGKMVAKPSGTLLIR